MIVNFVKMVILSQLILFREIAYVATQCAKLVINQHKSVQVVMKDINLQ